MTISQSEYFNKASPAATRSARVSSLPVAGDEVFAAGHRFYERIDAVRRLLADVEEESRSVIDYIAAIAEVKDF